MPTPPPIEPGDFPPDPFPPPSQLPGLGRFLRKRYTCNTVVSEQMSALDLLHDVINLSSRQFFTQSASGKLGLKNKKPVPYAFGTEQFSAAETALDVDAVTDWIGDTDTLLLVAPHTTSSEIRTVTGAAYSSSQNSITFSSTGGLFTIVGFAGCDGASTPATASITVNSATASTACTITLESTVFAFTTASSGETTESIASYIAGVIATHPALYRRFDVSWVSGAHVVNLTAKFGTLTIDSGLTYTTSTPMADPSTAPTLSGASSGSLAAGVYNVAYSAVNASGETLLSPFKAITLAANKKISVSTISLPSGATSLNWYVSPEADSTKLRYIANNNGTGFDITTLPALTAALPPDLNTSGCEVMKLSMAFSDRTTTRSAATRSNVLKASFSWFLGRREDTVNQIEMKYRDSADDWRLITLKLRDDASIAKVGATKSKEFNGQAIDNTDQAYRIAAGLLAERQDADFFYRWTATREALLLQEGDVVAITDDGSGVYNFPVIIEQIEMSVEGGLPKATFTGRKYSSRLYDDSVVERTIPIVSEAAV